MFFIQIPATLAGMTRVLLLIVALFGVGLAQSGAVLEVFVPAALPQTIKPNPVPNTMVDWPGNMSMGGNCSPSLKDLQVPTDVSNAKADVEVSKRIQAIVDADQAARKGTITSDIALEDAKRRVALLPLIPRAVTSEDFSSIALVFQHGDCVPHYMFANRMAEMGIKATVADADNQVMYRNRSKWLYAATLDRALMNSGRAQKYGTQYISFSSDECSRLYVVDPRTTDAERISYNVPTLEEAIARAKMFATPGCKP